MVGPGEDGGLLFGAVVDRPFPVMHEPMVKSAQRHPVVDVGRTLVVPRLGVVDVQDPSSAARPGALVVVAEQDGPTLSGVPFPFVAAHVKALAGAFGDNATQPGVTGQHAGRLPGDDPATVK